MENYEEVQAYYGYGWGVGLEIMGIEYGIDDKVKWRLRADQKSYNINTSKIRLDKADRSYFIAYKQRVYLDDCIRVAL